MEERYELHYFFYPSKDCNGTKVGEYNSFGAAIRKMLEMMKEHKVNYKEYYMMSEKVDENVFNVYYKKYKEGETVICFIINDVIIEED